MTNSREKGKRGERAAVRFLRELGFDARRTQQYNGEGVSDVTIEGRDDLHIEVKFGYPATRLHASGPILREAIEQAVRDSQEGQTPVVLWKARGQRDWKLSFPHRAWWYTTADSSAIVSLLRKVKL